MKLAVRKEPGSVPGGGYHYMLHPLAMASDVEAEIFRMMGYRIINVNDERGKRLLEQGRAALNHQIEVAYIVEDQAKERPATEKAFQS